MTPEFYNSLTKKTDKFSPINDQTAKMYTCGPTVYDYAHIGNFRAYIFEDILRRTLKYAGYNVTQVMNLTDVDDKTIKNSQQEGTPLKEYTEKYKKAFFSDIKTLNIEEAEYYPAATEHIDDMIKLVQKLVDKGYGYLADDGSVYFSIKKFSNYGQLVNIDPEQLQTTERIKQDEYEKESVADFALWKAQTPEDGDVAWDSPWGPGRPGWHIECSAMSERYLGTTFDIHTGGSDNMFPHHEDEIAQSEAANDCRFVNYWLHCAHLIVEGQKMSKSLGNFFTLRDLLDKGLSGRQIRWVLMSTHYRQSLNFTIKGCHDAQSALRRIDDFVFRLQEAEQQEETDNTSDVADLIEGHEKDFADCMMDDLNISGAQGVLFQFIRSANKLLDNNEIGSTGAENIRQFLKRCDKILGVINVDDKRKPSVPESVQQRLEEREQARKERDFQRADAIRDALQEEGWIIEDTAAGPVVKNA